MSSTSKNGTLAINATLTGLGIVAVGLRYYARKRQELLWMADDWFITVALVSFVGTTVCDFVLVHDHSLGYPTTNDALTEQDSKLNIVWDMFNDVALACIKFSILFFYRRVFGISHSVPWLRGLDRVTKATMVVVLLWLVVFIFLQCFQCGTHLSALWNGTYLQYCDIAIPMLVSLYVTDFVLDVWILLLPVPYIFYFHKSLKQRLSVMGLFVMAFIGLGASIAKMVVMIKIHSGGLPLFSGPDLPKDLTRASYFCVLETGMSLIAANLPPLWMLISQIPEKVAQSIRSMHTLSSGASRRSSRSPHSGSSVKIPSPGKESSTGYVHSGISPVVSLQDPSSSPMYLSDAR